MNLLLIEDDVQLAETLAEGLRESGHDVDLEHDGISGEVKALSGTYDVIVLDRLLPGQDGINVVSRLRSSGSTTPVLMLTALGHVDARVEGLDAGADDYLPKPFAFDELLARLRAIHRRMPATPPSAPPVVSPSMGPLRFDHRRRSVTVAGVPVLLRTKEYQLLELLVRRADTVLTRMQIADTVWGATYVSDDAMNMTVSSLRKKLRAAYREAGEKGPKIETVRGVGYRITAPR